jgi:hypothetical protein
MKNRELSRQKDRLDSLFKKVKNFEENNIEIDVISHWAKYLCVLCAGFLENAITEVFTDFCKSAASDNVANYARSSLSHINNPKSQIFFQVANNFSKNWGEKYTEFIELNNRKEAIDSIMSNRHLIAHGNNSDITLYRLVDWYKKSIEVIEFLEQLCNNPV